VDDHQPEEHKQGDEGSLGYGSRDVVEFKGVEVVDYLKWVVEENQKEEENTYPLL
jgi:hypothetical protein